MGGHVYVDDGANIGGNSSIHQFCRVGAYAMLGGHSFLKKDIPPFMIACGVPAVAKSYNRIGILRKGFSEEERVLIKQMYKLLYESDLNRSQALKQIYSLPNFSASLRVNAIFSEFLEQPSRRGLI